MTRPENRRAVQSLGEVHPMKNPRCPICDRAMPGPMAEWPNFPFCCDRCRQIDLGRWLGEAYRIPTSTLDEAESDSDPTSPS